MRFVLKLWQDLAFEQDYKQSHMYFEDLHSNVRYTLQELAPGQGVQLDEVESGDQDLKENPASSRNPKPGVPKVPAHCMQSHMSTCIYMYQDAVT